MKSEKASDAFSAKLAIHASSPSSPCPHVDARAGLTEVLLQEVRGGGRQRRSDIFASYTSGEGKVTSSMIVPQGARA